MSKQAAEWLGLRFHLSRGISSLDRDAANGYLLLEALNQCGIVADDALLAAQDSDDPTVVISNLNLLSKCLQPLGIDVSASDIASIASEQPGAAAKLVMAVRKVLDRPVNLPDGQKRERVSIKKSFSKTNKAALGGTSDTNAYLSDPGSQSVRKLKKAVDIHLDANMVKYKIFGAIVEEAKMKLKTDEIEAALLRRDRVRDELMRASKTVIEKNRNFQTTVFSGWVKQQKFMKRSQRRDLQYEVATSRRKQLLEDLRLQRTKEIVRLHLNDFEERQQLNQDHLKLINQTVNKPIVESQKEFLKRLEASVVQLCSAEDARSFVNKLKQKLSEQRSLSREQNARSSQSTNDVDPGRDEVPNNETAEHANIDSNVLFSDVDSDDDFDVKTEAVQESRPDVVQSDNNYISLKIVENYDINADEMTRKDDESSDCCENLCGSIVLEICDTVLKNHASSSKGTVKALFATENFFKTPNIVAASLQEHILGSGQDLKIDELYSMPDIWPCYTALSDNFGKVILSFDSFGKADIRRKEDTIESTCESIGKILLQVCPSEAMKASPLHARFPSLAITSKENGESETVKSHSFPTITIIQFPQAQDHINLQSALDAVVKWSGERTLVWDSVKALKCGAKLVDAYNQQGDQISIASLIECVGDAAWSPLLDSLESSFVPSSQALRVISDIIDITTRVLSTANVTTTTTKKKMPFSESSLAIISAQTLWLRQHVISSLCALANVEKFNQLFDSSVLVLAQPLLQKSIFTSIEKSDPMFVGVFDWFIRGNRRDNVDKGDPVLLQAIELDARSKSASKKSKGKDIEETVLLKSPIRSVLQLYNKSTTEFISVDPATFFSQYASVDLSQLHADPSSLANYIETILYYFHATKPVDTNKVTAVKTKTPKHVFDDLRERLDCPVLNIRIDSKVVAFDGAIDAFSSLSIAEILLTATLHNLDIRPPVNVEESRIDNLVIMDNLPSACALGASDVQYKEELISLRQHRRRQLPAVERIALGHLYGSNPLNIEELVRICFQFETNRRHHNLRIGAQTAVVDLVLDHLERSVQSEKSLLRPTDVNEQSFAKICAGVAARLYRNTTENAFACLDDLVCSIGDTLDSQHMAVLQTTEQFSSKVGAHASSAYHALCQACRGYGMLLLQSFEHLASSLNGWCDLIANAGHEFDLYPFTTISEDSIRPSKETHRKRGRILLNEIIDQSTESVRSSLDFSCFEALFHDDFLVRYLSMSKVAYSAICNLYDDILNQAISVLKGISASFKVIRDVKQRADDCVVHDIRLEHKSVHQALSDWRHKLRYRLSENYSSNQSEMLRNLLLKEAFKGKANDVVGMQGDDVFSINDLRTVAEYVIQDSLIETEVCALRSWSSREDSDAWETLPTSTIKDIADRLLIASSKSFGERASMVLSYFTEHYCSYKDLCSVLVSFDRQSGVDQVTIATPYDDISVDRSNLINTDKGNAESSSATATLTSDTTDEAEEMVVDRAEAIISNYKALVRQLLQAIVKDATVALFLKLRIHVPMSRIIRLGELLIPGKRSSPWRFPSEPILCSYDQYLKGSLGLLNENEYDTAINRSEWKSVVQIIAMASSRSGSLSTNDLVVSVQDAMLLMCRFTANIPSFVQREWVIQHYDSEVNQLFAKSMRFLEISRCRQLILATKLSSDVESDGSTTNAVSSTALAWLRSNGISYFREDLTSRFIDIKAVESHNDTLTEGGQSKPSIVALERSFLAIDEVISLSSV